MTMNQQPPSPALEVVKHLPGELGIWIFVFIDLTVFGALFVNYAWDRSHSNTWPAMELTDIDRGLGCMNTIALLTSSWCVAMAMNAVRHERPALARRLFAGALALGAAFIAIKIFEYTEKLSTGITPQTNSYFSYFFALTGLHLLHMMVGMSVLLWMRNRLLRITPVSHIQHLESGATFWHMVDLLWIIIFPLLYLM